MNISVQPHQAVQKIRTLFLPLFQNQRLANEAWFSFLSKDIRDTLPDWTRKEFQGDEGETESFTFPSGAPQRIVLFGLGEKKQWNDRKDPLVSRRMVQYAKRERMDSFATPLASLLKSHFNRDNSPDIQQTSRVFATNSLMAHFEYTKYKEEPAQGWPEVKSITLLTDPADKKETEAGIAEGSSMGEEVNACRTLANTPGSDMTPAVLAHEAVKVGKKYGIRVRILEEAEIKRLGMGGIIGVAKGSSEKPRFIIMEYRGQTRTRRRQTRIEKPLMLVGKGVTFDTGGLNVKPDQHMYEMHMDMSGGGAVIHGIAAVARLKLPISVVGIIPAVENMVSGSSYHPGDVLKSLSGKTIEVLNTDAEGRIILADALWYGHTKYKPGLMVDFATLTGAARVALGNYCSAIFTNREPLEAPLRAVGDASGDYVWPLPLWDEYFADIKGTFGDVANISSKFDRYGGAIHGAKFLEQFVADTPWAHVDIAPKMTTIDSEYLAKGASGVGVRYIVELAKQYLKLQVQMSKSK